MVVTYTEWSFKICLSLLYTIVYKLSEAIFAVSGRERVIGYFHRIYL